MLHVGDIDEPIDGVLLGAMVSLEVGFELGVNERQLVGAVDGPIL